MSPADYVALLDNRRRAQQRAREVLAQLDAEAYLTLASSGPAILGHEYTGSRTFLVYGSWLGFPAFALPLLDIGGLPCGVQLLGADGTDGALCSAARWVMREFAAA
jgi:Asp-tRNA(Asn)/Glu-tRNA(Gln) amidotransferase A subunit family amidase